METIITNVERIGNFTSSEIYRLMANGKAAGSLGKPAYEYIEEKNMERKLGRSLSEESNARPLTWGKLLEKRVFDLLPIDYSLFGDQTIMHPTIESWSGSPDATKDGVVSDVKCPVTLKSFCTFIDSGNINAIRENHKDGDKYYWQLVSNAILTRSNTAELIVYVPYLSELDAIKGIAINGPSDEMNRFYWIINAQQEELPYLIDGGYYKNLNIITFEIPQSDKDALTDRVLMAEKLLIPRSI